VLQLIREIGDLQVKVSNEQFQVAALQTLESSLETLSDVATTSLTNMNGIVHHWDDIVKNLEAAREVLVQPAVDVSILTPFKKIREAAASWRLIIERAGRVQASSIQTESAPIILKGDAA
jgi:hypothetical protein